MTCSHTFLLRLFYHQSDKNYYFNPICPQIRIYLYIYTDTHICTSYKLLLNPQRRFGSTHSVHPIRSVYLPYLLPPLQNSLTLPCLSNLIHASRPTPLYLPPNLILPSKEITLSSNIPRHIMLVPTCTKRLSLNHMQYQLFCK